MNKATLNNEATNRDLDKLLRSMTPEGKAAREEAMKTTNFFGKAMEKNENAEVETMSSRQIAELTKKNHADVVRDIKNMCDQLHWGISKFADTYIHPQNGQQYTEYNLPRYECEVLITGYDVQRRAAVIQRWHDLESGKALPIAHQMEPQPPADQYTLLTKNLKASQECKAFAESWGFEGNQALLTADRLVKAQTGFSPLEAMGQKALVASTQEMTYTPTELGKFYTPAYSPVTMNQMLQQAGMQERINDRWTPTDQGKEFSEILDVGKAHSDGTPVKQVKWLRDVTKNLLPVVSQSPADMFAAPAYEGGTGDTEQGANSAPADPLPAGIKIADPEKPLKTRKPHKKKPGCTRQVENPGRYGLGTHYSILELCDELDMNRKDVIDRLEKLRIIKWLARRKKYVLTTKGFTGGYGVMYDPSNKEIHTKETTRMIRSNARPVFDLKIVDLF